MALAAVALAVGGLAGCGPGLPLGGYYGGTLFANDAAGCDLPDAPTVCGDRLADAAAPADGNPMMHGSDGGPRIPNDVPVGSDSVLLPDAALLSDASLLPDTSAQTDAAAPPDVSGPTDSGGPADALPNNFPDTTGSADTIAPQGDGGGTSDVTKGPPTFTDVYDDVVMVYGCAAPLCHGKKGGGLAYFVDPDLAYDLMVNKASKLDECQFLPLVLPGQPEKSVLYHKVKVGAPTCGDKMPSGTTGLPEAAAQLIYDWIKSGAPK